MTFTRNTRHAVILIALIAMGAAGYFYYLSSKNVVEITLPSVKIERQ